MEFPGKNVPLRTVWLINLGLSALFKFCLSVVSGLSGNVVFFMLSYAVTILSLLVLVDWRALTLVLNVVFEVFATLSLSYICNSGRASEHLFKAKWQKGTIKWLFPLVCLHSICVSITVVVIKKRCGVDEDFPMKDVVGLLKDCDSYFSECKRQREKSLEDKKIAKEMRKIEIQKEEEVAKKIVDSLYGFTNRSNFPELEAKGDEDVDKLNKNARPVNTVVEIDEVQEEFVGNRVNRSVGEFNMRISIPDDLESLNSVRTKTGQ